MHAYIDNINTFVRPFCGIAIIKASAETQWTNECTVSMCVCENEWINEWMCLWII